MALSTGVIFWIAYNIGAADHGAFNFTWNYMLNTVKTASEAFYREIIMRTTVIIAKCGEGYISTFRDRYTSSRCGGYCSDHCLNFRKGLPMNLRHQSLISMTPPQGVAPTKGLPARLMKTTSAAKEYLRRQPRVWKSARSLMRLNEPKPVASLVE